MPQADDVFKEELLDQFVRRRVAAKRGEGVDELLRAEVHVFEQRAQQLSDVGRVLRACQCAGVADSVKRAFRVVVDRVQVLPLLVRAVFYRGAANSLR